MDFTLGSPPVDICNHVIVSLWCQTFGTVTLKDYEKTIHVFVIGEKT